MPTRPIRKNGKVIGYCWGKSGKLYLIRDYGKDKAFKLANKQGQAIHAAGWKGYGFLPKITVRKRRKDGVKQRYHINVARPKMLKNLKSKSNTIIEPKYDGTRMLAYTENQRTNLVNRRGVEKTDLYPEFKELQKYIRGDAIIDNELVILTKNKPFGDFTKLGTRDRLKDKEKIKDRHTGTRATLIALDIIKKGDKDLRNLPLLERKRILKDTIIPNNLIIPIESSNDQDKLKKEVREGNGEGWVVKDLNSKYEEGPTRVWEKEKIIRENDVAITGYTEGTGKNKPYFGALKMAIRENKRFKDVGLVGSGFKKKDLENIKRKLDKGEKLVARVKYRQKGSQGNYIEPRFVALRNDIKPEETHE